MITHTYIYFVCIYLRYTHARESERERKKACAYIYIYICNSKSMGASYLNNFTLETVSNYKIVKYPIFEPTHILACFFVFGINHVKLPYIDEPDGQKPEICEDALVYV